MKIEFIGNINNSGYGVASKGYIARLHKMGHSVRVVPITFVEGQEPKLDKNDPLDTLVGSLIGNAIGKPDVRLLHEVPHPMAALKYLAPDKVPTIWLYAWELNKLSPMYMENLRKADYCATFAEWQVDVYKKDMKQDNIFYLPHAMPTSVPNRKRSRSASTFTFFSMFRWDERKDPLTLIKAFLYGFKRTDDVRLVLKVSAVTADACNTAINNVMRASKLNKNFPPITVIAHDLSRSALEDLYITSDIFVSPTRGEGWGFGFNEALLHGLPVIYGDSPYIVKKFFNSSNSLPVKTHDVFVYNSCFPQVTDDMVWSQVDDVELARTMRYAYQNYEKLFKLPVNIDEEYLKIQNNLDDTINNMLNTVTGR